MNHEIFDRNQYNANNNFNNNSFVINNDRTTCNGFNSLEKTTDFQSNNTGNIQSMDYYVKDESGDCEKRDEINNNNTNIKIYRYKFSDDFIDELYKFSKIHQYDHRKDFKDAWELWLDDNSQIIFQESTRLIDLGYDGDVLNKMFTSARYYFRKKGTEKKEPRIRCAYIGLQKDLLDAMDKHITLNMSETWYKPSSGFTEFCKENIDLLKEEIELLIKFNIVASDEIKKKIKKTYKNRYFMIINKK